MAKYEEGETGPTGAKEADEKLVAAVEQWWRESSEAVENPAMMRGWMIIAEGRCYDDDGEPEVVYLRLNRADSVQRLALTRYLNIKVKQEFAE